VSESVDTKDLASNAMNISGGEETAAEGGIISQHVWGIPYLD